jgi:hypothetical protein
MTEANSSGSWQTCLFIPGMCDFVAGDGVGGTEVGVGAAATAAECVALVESAQPDANGATYSNTGGTGCYAEFGMTGPNDSTGWQTCMFPEVLNVCDFVPGDGVGGTETLVGDAASMQECAQLVRDTSTEANGATYSATGGTACYAEFGATSANGSASWITCFFSEVAEDPVALVQGCSWVTGDGVGGSESFAGDAASQAECVSLVVATSTDANGATYSNTGGTQCYAEFGMTGNNDSASWQTCLFIPNFCEYVLGDGIGGTESGVGAAATALECVALVQAAEPTANGATYSATGGTGCYAEFGMTGPNTSTGWQVCQFPESLMGCTYGVGDGVGGTESYVGDASTPADCAALVQSEAPDANGATYSSTGSSTACYAEFGMTGVNGSTSWQTCIFSMEPVCGFVLGDGVGGTEAGVGSAGDAQACAALVMANEPTANGATFSNTGGTGCYAEFGMTGANDSAGWQSCMFDGTVGR